MGKHKNKNRVPVPDDAVCQGCKAHTNKPSRCSVLQSYVGRKRQACDLWIAK